MSENQRGRIMDGLKAKMAKYGDPFIQFYSRKEPLLGEKVMVGNGTITISDMTWKEASSLLQNVIWQKSDMDREFQDFISGSKGGRK